MAFGFARFNTIGLFLFGTVSLSALAQSAGPAVEETAAGRTLETIRVIDRPPNQPGALAVMVGSEIDDISADHPAELLNTLPGVNIHINSGQEHLLAIRSPVLTGGAGQGSFLILQNGVPTRSPAFGNVNMLFEVHHEVAEAVERSVVLSK